MNALRCINEQLSLPLRAVHVNHGLQAQAPRWEAHCHQFAAAQNVPLTCVTVAIDPADPRGLEAAAREARYGALAGQLRTGEWLLTAHHADDQLETVLLQLMRGAGVAGLAGIAADMAFAKGRLVRPLLGFTRKALADWGRAQQLISIDDPSNANTHYDRNFLRHHVIPTLTSRWPSAALTGVRSAAHAGAATRLQATLAASDLAPLATPRDTLPVQALLALGEERAANVFRYWLGKKGLAMPSARQLGALFQQAKTASASRVPRLRWANVEARVWRGNIYAFAARGPRPALPLRWYGQPLEPGHGVGVLQTIEALGGLDPAIFRDGIVPRWRKGGERIQTQASRPVHRVKGLLREAGVPPWERDWIPFFWHGNDLVAVGERWTATSHTVSPTQKGLAICRVRGQG